MVAIQRITWQPCNESQGGHTTSPMALAFLCPVSCNEFHENRKPLKHLCICILFRGCTPPPRLMQCLSLVGIGWVGWSKCQFPATAKVPVRIAHYEPPLPRCIVRCKVSAYLCLGLGQGLPYAVHWEPRTECIIRARALFCVIGW